MMAAIPRGQRQKGIIPVAGIVGHRQVTDAYLAHLARSHSARLVTFDQALAKLHRDVADLIPVG
jgi:uncharacterized protein